MQPVDYIPQLQEIAHEAGERILTIYSTFTTGDEFTKDDDSPLTKADLASQELIVAELQKLTPNIPIMAEEGEQQSYDERKDRTTFWCVDPLDGTKEFVKKNGEFTINIALIEDGQPVLGIIYIPVQHVGYYAAQGHGAWRYDNQNKKQISATDTLDDGQINIMCSRSHLNVATKRFLEQVGDHYDQVEAVPAGSSLKFCRVAEGKAHLYPRFAPTKEWDTAPGQIIVAEAGAKMLTLPDHTPLAYNKPSIVNPSFYVSSVEVEKELFE